MTLQRRLALTLLIAAIPLLAIVAWVRVEIVRRTDEQALRDVVLSRAAAIGRETCEASPERFFEPGPPPGRPPMEPGGFGRRPGGPPESFDRPPEAERRPPGPGRRPPGPGPRGMPMRPLQTFVYDDRLESQSPFAPSFPSELRAVASGEAVVSRRVRLEDQPRPFAGNPATEEDLEMLEMAVRTDWSGGPCAVILARRIGPASSAASWNLLASVLPLLAGLVAVVWVASGPLVRRVRTLTDAVKRSAQAHYLEPVPESGRDEITALARAFNEAGAEVRGHLASLERRDRTLREFLANTTHDVMIPLTVLQGHLSELQRRARDGEATDPAVVVAALQEAQYMSSILHNLGAAAKLDAPDTLLHRHPVDLNALVERVVERHRPVARPAGIDIDFAVPERQVSVDGDVTLLEQAVSNVVHNAVRYNHAGGHVAVVLDVLDQNPGGFRLRVADDGPGVPEDRLARLTDRRYRDDVARQRDPNGLGLGLSIAREVAERHGIELHVRRAEQGGLEVEFLYTPPASNVHSA